MGGKGIRASRAAALRLVRIMDKDVQNATVPTTTGNSLDAVQDLKPVIESVRLR